MHRTFSRRYRAPLVWASVVGVLHLVPANDSLGPGGDWLEGLLTTVPFADKVAHALLFFVLAALVVRALRDAGVAAQIGLTIGLCLAYGLLLELGQTVVPGRSAEALDGLADAVGAVLGAILTSGASAGSALAADAEAETRADGRHPDETS